MNITMRARTTLRLLCAIVAGWAAPPSTFSVARANSEAESYAAWSGGTVVPPGRIEIDGRRMACGTAPTVLDPGYKDFGGFMSGFLILNPHRFTGYATPIKLWIFSHECAHQTAGPDEVKADCIAVQRGKREGWLTPAGLAQICDFMRPTGADETHLSGPQRCELMRKCLGREDSK